jgi:ElaB/YqjD/DUF883 family membrane-anchored ribosome-binding protein
MNDDHKPVDELREKVNAAYASGRDKAETALKTVRDSSAKAAAATKDSVKTAAKSTTEGLEKNPLIALVGGIALGAIAAALLPKTERETKTFGKTSSRLRETASSAVKAARTAGKDQLDALGVNSGAARDQLRDVISKIGEAATTATKAATDAVRKR